MVNDRDQSDAMREESKKVEAVDEAKTDPVHAGFSAAIRRIGEPGPTPAYPPLSQTYVINSTSSRTMGQSANLSIRFY
jgi:hypothetical protein